MAMNYYGNQASAKQLVQVNICPDSGQQHENKERLNASWVRRWFNPSKESGKRITCLAR